MLACLIGAGFAGANIYLNSLNQNLAGDEQEAEEVKEVLKAAPVENKPFYMLLIGCDDREGVDGARADTTILARLDPKKNKVTLISIPRDTAIEIDGYGMQKFNAAYTYGGASGTIEAASELCGVEISHYAEVHFEALIDIIDYIGGVDVDVPIGIDDVDAGGKVDAGMQHLDGEHAMIFARSRSYETGDFQRTTSQRLLIDSHFQTAGLGIDEEPLRDDYVEVLHVLLERAQGVCVPVDIPRGAHAKARIGPLVDVFLRKSRTVSNEAVGSVIVFLVGVVHALFQKVIAQ